jgi:KaiC/GvpD/RAD55 family RecA-like ATPase
MCLTGMYQLGWKNLMNLWSKIDINFRGGFLKGAVSQIYGEAGTAKSQLVMQFIIGASLHGNNTFVISTDKMFHTQRFDQLKSHY